jgi:putative flippase GtrA
MIRYGASGGLLAGLYSAIYWILAAPCAIPALLANTIAFLANLAAGWLLHSRWSFRGHGLPGKPHIAYARFLAVNLAGYGLNSLWVWLIVERMGAAAALAILPIVFVTPILSFFLNRIWIFRSRL